MAGTKTKARAAELATKTKPKAAEMVKKTNVKRRHPSGGKVENQQPKRRRGE